MGFEDVFASLGAVPSGARSKTVIEEGGKPGYYQTDPLSNLLRGLTRMQQQSQADQEKKKKTFNNQIDMYKTLRQAGYSPDRAFKSVTEGELEEPGAIPEKKEETNMKDKVRMFRSLKNSGYSSEKAYDSVESGSLAAPDPDQDVPIKKSVRPEKIKPVSEKAPAMPKIEEERVAVISPDGKPGTLPKSKLNKALKQGYKLRR
jgi:hypothetical protein